MEMVLVAMIPLALTVILWVTVIATSIKVKRLEKELDMLRQEVIQIKLR